MIDENIERHFGKGFVFGQVKVEIPSKECNKYYNKYNRFISDKDYINNSRQERVTFNNCSIKMYADNSTEIISLSKNLTNYSFEDRINDSWVRLDIIRDSAENVWAVYFEGWRFLSKMVIFFEVLDCPKEISLLTKQFNPEL